VVCRFGWSQELRAPAAVVFKHGVCKEHEPCPRGSELVDNNATRSLVQMLPLTIEMRDHLRQEKTGNLPSPLPAVERQLDFSTGTLGLWSSNHFVIYYRDGRVPQPGIILIGRVTDDVSIFDRRGPVTVRVESCCERHCRTRLRGRPAEGERSLRDMPVTVLSTAQRSI
jgi:hypothetical protein